MKHVVSEWGIHLIFISLISLLLVLATNPGVWTGWTGWTIPDSAPLQSFKTMFIGLVLEAMPFILLGVLLSSFMQVYVSEQWIQRLIPRNPWLGLGFACLLGILFPVCECGLIPVIRRLIAKGMPLYVGVVFILVGPIVNPIVYAATYSAFRLRPDMLYARMGLALVVGAAIGWIVWRYVKKNPLRHTAATVYAGENGSAAEHRHGSRRSKAAAMMEHAGSEFFDMGKYFMFGALLTAAIQAFVPRSSLADIGGGTVSSHLFMMGLAYVLSLCSTSDAFVASSFISTFSAGSLLAFMVFGPMLDFKSTLMLLSVFKARFVLLLALLIAALVLTGSLLLQHFYFQPSLFRSS